MPILWRAELFSGTRKLPPTELSVCQLTHRARFGPRTTKLLCQLFKKDSHCVFNVLLKFCNLPPSPLLSLSTPQKPYPTVASLSALPDNLVTEHQWVFFTASAVALRPLLCCSWGAQSKSLWPRVQLKSVWTDWHRKQTLPQSADWLTCQKLGQLVSATWSEQRVRNIRLLLGLWVAPKHFYFLSEPQMKDLPAVFNKLRNIQIHVSSAEVWLHLVKN